MISEAEIRDAVRQSVLERLPNAVLIEELGIRRGTVVADVAYVGPDVFAAVEIKSDADNLRRLPMQALVYSQVFDRVGLATTARYVDRAASIVPDWWELLVAVHRDGRTALEVQRPGRDNPETMPQAVAEFLWREEAMALLRERGAAKGLSRASAPVLRCRLCEVLPLDELRAIVRGLVCARAAQRGALAERRR